MYGHLWGTPAARGSSTSAARLQCWLDVLAALARAQAAEGIVPGGRRRGRSPPRAQVELLDLDLVAEQTRATGHSTLGLIRGLQQVLPEDVHAARLCRCHRAGPHRHLDLAGAARRSARQVWRDLRALEELLLDLAAASPRHRDGRSHPRPARRADHLRLEGRVVGRRGPPAPRPAARGRAALAGRPARRRGRDARRASGRDGLGGAPPVLRRARAARPGHLLADRARPDRRVRRACWRWSAPPWRASATRCTSCSDRRSASCASPPRPAPSAASPCRTSGIRSAASTWTPWPGWSARNAGVLLEGMVGGHERDGRGWKAEWVALPEVCLLTATATALAVELVEGLEVDAAAMRANLIGYAGQRAGPRRCHRLGSASTRRSAPCRTPWATGRTRRPLDAPTHSSTRDC